jgi:hypothetical protein
MWHMWRRGKVHIGFWWGKLREGIHLEDTVIDSRIILEWILKKSVGRTWTGLIWLRIGTSGRLWLTW